MWVEVCSEDTIFCWPTRPGSFEVLLKAAKHISPEVLLKFRPNLTLSMFKELTSTCWMKNHPVIILQARDVWRKQSPQENHQHFAWKGKPHRYHHLSSLMGKHTLKGQSLGAYPWPWSFIHMNMELHPQPTYSQVPVGWGMLRTTLRVWVMYKKSSEFCCNW